MNKYAQYFAIEKKLKQNHPHFPNRSELIQQFTDQSKSGLSELTPHEYKEFMQWLRRSYPVNNALATNNPANRMRRKIIALFIHQMGYDMAGLERWCQQYGKFKKGLNDHTHAELVQLVNQAESVYAAHVKNFK